MKTTQTLLLAATLSAGLFVSTGANAATCPSAGCDANWLNVPGDFANPINNFTMHLLGGWFAIDNEYVDASGQQRWEGLLNDPSGNNPINTLENKINFTAARFNHIGLGQGTSVLNASLNHLVIGTGENFFGWDATIYADGQATGALVDNASSTQGNWTLNTHLYADWGVNFGIDLGIITLSTNATYTYCTLYDCSAPNSSVSGSIMDYHTGLAYLVGQGTIQSGDFQGLRVTIGLNGQDPVSAVPVPATAWLFVSGLFGLIGIARCKAA